MNTQKHVEGTYPTAEGFDPRPAQWAQVEKRQPVAAEQRDTAQHSPLPPEVAWLNGECHRLKAHAERLAEALKIILGVLNHLPSFSVSKEIADEALAAWEGAKK